MSATDELKPCPFCGATDEVMTIGDFWAGAIPAEAEVANQVGCTVCDIWTPAFDTEEEAIDAWNRRALSEQFESLTVDMEPMTDEDMAEHGWMRLPKDADGVPIHIGDVMDTEHFGTVEVEGFVHHSVAFYNYSEQPAYLCTTPVNLCHHHKPTVEDVLREFAERYLDYEGVPDAGRRGVGDELMAEYAEKLREVVEHEGD